MLGGRQFDSADEMAFKSIRKNYDSFEEVFEDILEFISEDRDASYRISVGTDSQVYDHTVFITCIHVHRIGKGAIGFLHRSEVSRRLNNLKEKIYLETCMSLQVASLFDDSKIEKINNAIISNEDIRGKNVSFEFHIDIGVNGETKTLINEMVGMVKGINFTPKIKPDSYCASCYADRYTKAM